MNRIPKSILKLLDLPRAARRSGVAAVLILLCLFVAQYWRVRTLPATRSDTFPVDWPGVDSRREIVFYVCQLDHEWVRVLRSHKGFREPGMYATICHPIQEMSGDASLASTLGAISKRVEELIHENYVVEEVRPFCRWSCFSCVYVQKARFSGLTRLEIVTDWRSMAIQSAAVWSIFFVLFAILTTIRRIARLRSHRCLYCGYPIAAPTCPECGKPTGAAPRQVAE
jgi:hypothetical protein